MSVKLRERKLAKGAFKYYLDIYQNGDRFYEFLDIKVEAGDTKEQKAEKKKIANLIKAKRELEIITQTTDYLPKHLQNINFFDFANAYIKDYEKKDVRMISSALNKFEDYVNNSKLRLVDISPAIMSGFIDYLNDKSGLTGESPHNYYTRFKKILRDAELKGLIRVSPTRNLKFRRKNSPDELRKQVLTSEELQLLVKTECGNSELKKAFLFACYTGLGYAEIKALKWTNLKNSRLITRRAKTNQKVDVKLKDSLVSMLGKNGKNDDSVFNLLNEDGNPISDNGINKCLKNWVERAEIDKHITFYCARHTFATQLLLHGANLKTVADALGHANTRNTIKYLNYIDGLKDSAVDNLPELNF
ncbi:site-specific integrase [Aestuariibaculum suncheonense]|uniref:Site-specific integrase n=1 Tax=Aestuariibaculum suncheonense TaxID=1028745 RepID=A0A8J6QL41_9FLAO|nr:site-specific integrase [Aestuariibaculum suncheonense]MBD0836526.1 site-specific integrase [Aestuariibaculum suncheonense]